MNNLNSQFNQPSTPQWPAISERSAVPPRRPGRKLKLKWLVRVIIGVEIALIGLAGYLLLKPTKVEEVINWSTYRDEEQGFEIKYPQSWHSYQDIGAGHRIISTFSEEKYKEYFGTEKHRKLGRNSGFILLIPINTGKSVEETFNLIKDRLEQVKEEGENFKIGEFIAEEVNIEGTKGYRIYYPYYENVLLYEKGVHVIYLFSDDKSGQEGFLLEGDFAGKDKEVYEKYVQIFDQMVSTFRFIKCEGQPRLIGLGFKYNRAADKIFIEENNKLRPLTNEEWQRQGYKWNCVEQYYIEDSFPAEVLDKLSESQLLTKTTSNRQYWKTYSNKNLGIEFKYPGEWQIKELLSLETAEKRIESRVPYGYYRTVLGPLAIWLDNSIAGADWGLIDEIETILINGEKALLITRDLEKNVYYTVKLSVRDQDFYLKYTPSQQGSLDWTEAYHQIILATILSTFKFLPSI